MARCTIEREAGWSSVRAHSQTALRYVKYDLSRPSAKRYDPVGSINSTRFPPVNAWRTLAYIVSGWIVRAGHRSVAPGEALPPFYS
jgi:hypothetical protein